MQFRHRSKSTRSRARRSDPETAIGRPTISGRLTELCILVAAVACFAAACATNPSRPTAAGESGPLFEVPRHWEIVDEREGDSLYQANLKNNDGSGRMLIGRLEMQEVGELEGYLFRLHTDLVDRIRGEVDVAPFAEDRLAWKNGIVGYRTKMRGQLGNEAIIIEGITFSDGDNAYFQYGLFPEDVYQTGQRAYASVLGSFAPLRGAEKLENQGMNIAAAGEPRSSEIGSDGATSPDDYHSPETQLGMAKWGSTRSEIEAQAGLPLRKGNKAVGYRCQYVGTDDCVVIYIFEYGQLTHGGFLFESDFSNPQDYVARYLQMTKKLTARLGRPAQSSAIWSDPTYRQQGSKWGEALANQQVIFGTVWDIGPTKVVHSLRKTDEGEIEHRLLMSNVKLRNSARASQPQASAD
jgi:hypothetical protein